MAMVDTKALKPKGFPFFPGNNFFLIGYRIFVRYTNAAGKTLRGLYILKSETNSKKMELLGNFFTHYNYKTTDITQIKKEEGYIIKSVKSDFEIVIENTQEEIALPPGSPFENWKEARRFAGPLPFTFSGNELKNQVLIIEGVREHWQPVPIKISSYHIGFLNDLNLCGSQLANAFEIKKIPYYWKKGKIEKWH
ncbi:MAG: hypothetical protein ABJB11_05640 [Ferruginibacter sp.]